MSEIDSYLEQNATESQRVALQHIRELVYEIIPDVEEVIAYALPTFKYKGKSVFHMGAFKDHMSLFPSPQPIESLMEKLADFKTAKGTIQFSESNPVPDELLKELIVTSFESVKTRLKP